MPRRSRLVIPGLPHHVTHRGIRRADIFGDDDDRRLYLALLNHYHDVHCLKILAYALMTNHIHLIAVPESEEALGNSIRDAHGTYASRFNRKYEFTGHVWEARFYSTPLDEDHLRAAVRYVERNPLRANMVKRSEDYPWSSAPAHVHGVADPLIDPTGSRIDLTSDWRSWLEDEGDPSHVRAIRKATSTGRPCGSDQFIKTLEGRLGRSLHPQIRGPKQKTKTFRSDV